MPAKPHCFANLAAFCRLPERLSLSDSGGLPALVMKNTWCAFCLIASRIQISGVKDDRMMFRAPPKRAIWFKILSTKTLISMETGAIPASRASWMRGYSRNYQCQTRCSRRSRRTDFHVKPCVLRNIAKNILQRSECILNELSSRVRLEAFVQIVYRVLHSVLHLYRSRFGGCRNRS